jgi:hypothetical protein
MCYLLAEHEHDEFLCGEEHRYHSFFAPTACRVLGMTSAAEQANLFEDAVMKNPRF